MDIVQILGYVRDGRFYPLDPQQSHSAKRSTWIALTSSPVSDDNKHERLELNEYEGKVIMISGDMAGGEGESLYSVKTDEVAGPIVSQIAWKVFKG